MKFRFFIQAFFLIALASIVTFRGCWSSNRTDSYAGLSLPILYQLMDATGLTYEKTPESIVAATQAGWLRKGERWETGDLFEEKKEALKPFLQRLNLIDPWMPSGKSYDGVLFFGSLVSSMNNKLLFLRQLVQDGLTFNQIIFLAGERFLIDSEKEQLIIMGADISLVKTETDAIKFLVTLPENRQALGKVAVQFVNASQKVLPDGTKQRPTTADTIEEWMRQGAQPEHFLAISQQPFCTNQKLVLSTLLPRGFEIEVVGAGDGYKSRVAVYLDTIARTLYQQFRSFA